MSVFKSSHSSNLFLSSTSASLIWRASVSFSPKGSRSGNSIVMTMLHQINAKTQWPSHTFRESSSSKRIVQPVSIFFIVLSPLTLKGRTYYPIYVQVARKLKGRLSLSLLVVYIHGLTSQLRHLCLLIMGDYPHLKKQAGCATIGSRP